MQQYFLCNYDIQNCRPFNIVSFLITIYLLCFFERGRFLNQIIVNKSVLSLKLFITLFPNSIKKKEINPYFNKAVDKYGIVVKV